jgi:sulfatase maturation enzyme AslB (radical SAM superfamily)
MKKIIYLALNAAGCKTACIHCWANGGRYKNMSFDDFRFVTDSFRDFTENNGYAFAFNMMHEFLAHPNALSIWRLRNVQNKKALGYESNEMPTSGIPIAIREDYKELLNGLKENGLKGFNIVLHGIGQTHDRAVGCKDAFEKIKLAVERIEAAELTCGFGVLLTKINIHQLKQIKDFIRSCGTEKAFFNVATYISGNRLHKYDEIRPEYADILPFVDEIKEMCTENFINSETLEDNTEKAYYAKAIEGKDVNTGLDKKPSDMIFFVCDKDFNIYHGSSVVFGKCYGNLKDNASAVFEKINDDISNDCIGFEFAPSLFYPNETIPSVKELAERYGDKNGQKIYTSGIYYKWLDNALLKV